MGQCNLCLLAEIKRQAKKEGKVVVKKPGTFGLGGVDLFVLRKGEKLDRGKHFRAWCMKIPEGCEC